MFVVHEAGHILVSPLWMDRFHTSNRSKCRLLIGEIIVGPTLRIFEHIYNKTICRISKIKDILLCIRTNVIKYRNSFFFSKWLEHEITGKIKSYEIFPLGNVR